MIIWITGQPGSGKSTLAQAIVAWLEAQGRPAARLDGDELRIRTGNTDYSAAGRRLNVQQGQKLALQLVAEGKVVVAAFVSPHRDLRERLKAEHAVLEVFAHTHIATAKDAFHVPDYEPPLTQFVDVDTAALSMSEAVRKVTDILGQPRF